MDTLLPSQVEQLKGIFAVFSRSTVTADGMINVLGPSELASVLQALGLQTTESELAEYIARADKAGRGWLDAEEFVHLMAGELKDVDLDLEAANAFEWADRDGDGVVGLQDLAAVLADGAVPGTQVAAEVPLTRGDLQLLVAGGPTGASGMGSGSVTSAGRQLQGQQGLTQQQFVALLRTQQ